MRHGPVEKSLNRFRVFACGVVEHGVTLLAKDEVHCGGWNSVGKLRWRGIQNGTRAYLGFAFGGGREREEMVGREDRGAHDGPYR